MRKHKHVQHTHRVRGAIMQSVELKVSLRQEWDQTRWPFFPIGGGRGGGEKGTQRKQIQSYGAAPLPETTALEKMVASSFLEMTRDFSVFTQKYIVHIYYIFVFTK